MKYLPFKQIVFSLMLPALMYVWFVPLCEKGVTAYHRPRMTEVLLHSDRSLLEGEVGVKEVVRDNLGRYVETHLSLALFSSRTITVRTGGGELVFPVSEIQSSPLDDRQVVAAENYRLLERGLKLEIALFTGPDAPLSVMALALFSVLALLALYRVYRKQVRYSFLERIDREQAIASLEDGQRAAQEELDTLSARQESLQGALEQARTALVESAESQTGMEEEIEVLESLIEENEAQLIAQKGEIDRLTRHMADQKQPVKEKKNGKRAHREKERIARRLSTLYKHLGVHDRAIQGFLALDESMRLKCEELIHQLNEDPAGVPVKRKVFGGKGLNTFLEAEFAYKGRLYFMRLPGGKAEVVAIGTKNTQATELGYLHRISSGMKSA